MTGNTTTCPSIAQNGTYPVCLKSTTTYVLHAIPFNDKEQVASVTIDVVPDVGVAPVLTSTVVLTPVLLSTAVPTPDLSPTVAPTPVSTPTALSCDQLKGKSATLS